MYVKTDVQSYKKWYTRGSAQPAPTKEKTKDFHLRWFGRIQRRLKIAPYNVLVGYNLQVQVTKWKGRVEEIKTWEERSSEERYNCQWSCREHG